MQTPSQELIERTVAEMYADPDRAVELATVEGAFAAGYELGLKVAQAQFAHEASEAAAQATAAARRAKGAGLLMIDILKSGPKTDDEVADELRERGAVKAGLWTLYELLRDRVVAWNEAAGTWRLAVEVEGAQR